MGYLLVADLLGFRNIVTNLSGTELADRIDEWVKLIMRLLERHSIQQYQLLSDTLFVATNDDADQLPKLVGFSRDLLSEGIALDLPVRGAISRGEYQWGSLIYGKAVIAAHQLESEQQWIGITCDASINVSYWGPDKLVCYPVPLRQGVVQIKRAVGWEIPDIKTLLNNLSRRGLATKHEVFRWEWVSKAENTTNFGAYLRYLRSTNGTGERFDFWLPTGLIDHLSRQAFDMKKGE